YPILTLTPILTPLPNLNPSLTLSLSPHTTYRSRMHPLAAAVGPVLFLPDRHDFLEPVDGITAGLESLGPMRTTDSPGTAHFAHSQVSETVYHHHITHGPTATGFTLDLGHFLLGHAGIRLVVQGSGHPSVGQVADRTEKDHPPAAVGPAN